MSIALPRSFAEFWHPSGVQILADPDRGSALGLRPPATFWHRYAMLLQRLHGHRCRQLTKSRENIRPGFCIANAPRLRFNGSRIANKTKTPWP